MVTSLQRRVDQIDGFYLALQNQKKGLEDDMSTIKGEIDILTKCSAVLKHLLDVMVKDEITKMAGLVTYGLKAVFEDQDLSFIPTITKKNDKVHIELRTKNGAIEGEFGSYGGSVAVIESMLLRIICLLKKDMARVLFLDETFASVNDMYVPNTTKFISELCKKLGLDVLLVTQQKAFQENADHVYLAKESENGLIMEKLK
jgi:hypothetical protein